MNKKCLFLFIIAIIGLNLGLYAQSVSSSGAFTYSYPIEIPDGTNGMQPELSLEYNSQAGNGMLGMGWSLAGLQTISRDTTYPINWDNTDHFVLNGQRLIPDGVYYRTATESFLRIEYVNPSSSASYWVVTNKKGTQFFFGNTADSRIEAVGHGSQARVWALNKVLDVHGNYYVVEYDEDSLGGDYYPVRIVYTKNDTGSINLLKEVSFEYEDRLDHWLNYNPSNIDRNKRLNFITISINNERVKKHDMHYANQSSAAEISKLTSINVYGTDDMDSLDFDFFWTQKIGGWQQFGSSLNQFSPGTHAYSESSIYPILTGDWNGDGRIDIGRVHESGVLFYFSTGDGWLEYGASLYDFSPGEHGYSDSNRYPIYTGDWNGDGKTDLGRVHETGVKFYISTGNGWQQYGANLYDFSPGAHGYADSDRYPTYTGDWNGDGKTDIGRTFESGVLFYLSTGNGWQQYGASLYDFSPGEHGYSDPNRYPIYTGDWNGDGKTDIGRVHETGVKFYASTGNGWQQYGASLYDFSPGTHGYADSDRYPTYTGDWNGDGKTDIGRTFESGVLFYLSTGNGWQQYGASLYDFSPGTHGYSDPNRYPIYTGDWNGDGKTDIGRVHETGVKFYLSIGNGWQQYGTSLYDFSPGAHGYADSKRYPYYTGDWNGDGKTDIGRVHERGVLFYNSSEAACSDWIDSIYLPSGATITPTYTPAPQLPGAITPSDSTYPDISNKSPRALVTALEITDGNNNSYTTTYAYHNGKIHKGYPDETKNLGFEWIKKTNPDGTSHITYYHQEEALLYAGAVTRTESYGSDGKLYGAVENSYAVDQLKASTADYHAVNFIKKTDSSGYNFNGVSYSDWNTMKNLGGIRKTRRSYQYDANGNLVRILDENDVSDPSDDVLAVTSYLSHSSKHIVAPEYVKVYSYGLNEVNFNPGSLESPGNLASYMDYYYDGLEGYRGLGDYGLLTKAVAYSGEADQAQFPDSVSEYGYDVYGNVKTVKDGRGNGSTIHYDPDYHSRVQSVENALGQTVETVGYDSLMRPEFVRDMNNNYTWLAYDEFGRVIRVSDGNAAGPVTTLSKMTYVDIPSAPGQPRWVKRETYLPENPNNFLEEYVYLDGLGRILQEKQESSNASGTTVWTTVDYHYDLAARKMRVSEPYESGSSFFSQAEWNTVRDQTTYHMDEIGRVDQVDYFQGISEYFHFGIDNKTVLTHNSENPNENLISYMEVDGRSRLSYTYPKGNYSPSSIADFGKDSWVYKVTSTAARDGATLHEISREDEDYSRPGNTIFTLNDNLGRKKSYDDPDMGLWSYAYDANGNLTRQTDAKGNILTLEYDALNRVKIKHGVDTVYYNYDGLTNDRSAPDGKDHGPSVNGLLTSISFADGAYGEDYYYDFANDTYRLSKTIDRKTRTYEVSLDEIGRVADEILPGSEAETLSYSYNATGNMEALTNNLGLSYISDLKYNILGKIEGFTQGNGTLTDYQYNEKNRLTNITITNGADRIADMSFQYDNYGNLTEKSFADDFGHAYSETYSYDDLFRLSRAESVGLYGTKTYEYDSYNNMINNDGKLYHYSGTNPEDGGPHAVEEIHSGTGQTLKTYEYDDNGNVTKITGRSSIQVRAKGEGVVNNPPRMELWINGQGPETVWTVSRTEYQTYSWHGYLPADSTVSVVFANDNTDGGADTNLIVDFLTVNGVEIQSESGGVSYDRGGYSSGCFDGTDSLPGQERMNLTGALHYLIPSGVHVLDRVLQYDAENRLTTILDNGTVSASYRYDDMGQRIWKVENGVKTYYFFHNYEEEYDKFTGDLIQSTTYYFANGQRIAQKSGGEVSYYHTDHLGSAVRMTDETGAITQSIAYTPFGKVAWFSGKDVTHYTFTGQESDNSGFMYYNARYYDPDLGRFLQPDTFLDGMNRYTYCGNNPVRYVDPTGMRKSSGSAGRKNKEDRKDTKKAQNDSSRSRRRDKRDRNLASNPDRKNGYVDPVIDSYGNTWYRKRRRLSGSSKYGKKDKPTGDKDTETNSSDHYNNTVYDLTTNTVEPEKVRNDHDDNHDVNVSSESDIWSVFFVEVSVSATASIGNGDNSLAEGGGYSNATFTNLRTGESFTREYTFKITNATDDLESRLSSAMLSSGFALEIGMVFARLQRGLSPNDVADGFLGDFFADTIALGPVLTSLISSPQFSGVSGGLTWGPSAGGFAEITTNYEYFGNRGKRKDLPSLIYHLLK